MNYFFFFFSGIFFGIVKIAEKKEKKKSPFLVGGVCFWVLCFGFCVLGFVFLGSLHTWNLPPSGVATVSIVVERGQTCLFNAVFQNVIDH